METAEVLKVIEEKKVEFDKKLNELIMLSLEVYFFSKPHRIKKDIDKGASLWFYEFLESSMTEIRKIFSNKNTEREFNKILADILEKWYSLDE